MTSPLSCTDFLSLQQLPRFALSHGASFQGLAYFHRFNYLLVPVPFSPVPLVFNCFPRCHSCAQFRPAFFRSLPLEGLSRTYPRQPPSLRRCRFFTLRPSALSGPPVLMLRLFLCFSCRRPACFFHLVVLLFSHHPSLSVIWAFSSINSSAGGQDLEFSSRFFLPTACPLSFPWARCPGYAPFVSLRVLEGVLPLTPASFGPALQLSFTVSASRHSSLRVFCT